MSTEVQNRSSQLQRDSFTGFITGPTAGLIVRTHWRFLLGVPAAAETTTDVIGFRSGLEANPNQCSLYVGK